MLVWLSGVGLWGCFGGDLSREAGLEGLGPEGTATTVTPWGIGVAISMPVIMFCAGSKYWNGPKHKAFKYRVTS